MVKIIRYTQQALTINSYMLLHLLSISSLKEKLRHLCCLARACLTMNDHHWVVVYSFHDALLLHQDRQLLTLFLLTCIILISTQQLSNYNRNTIHITVTNSLRLGMLNDNRKIDYRNGFSFLFSCLYYRFSKWVRVHWRHQALSGYLPRC